MHERYNGPPAFSAGLVAIGRRLRRAGALVLATLGLAVGARAQQLTPYFRADAEARSAAAGAPLAAALKESRALTLDEKALRAVLATAPREGQAGTAPLELALPRPDGRVARYAVRETSVMVPKLARQFPTIKTYAGVGLDDRSASLRLDLTPRGFHAQVLSGSGQSYYIDPVTRADAYHYLVFYRYAMDRAAAGAALVCGTAPTAAELSKMAQKIARARPSGTAATGSQLRTFRLALANTAEYAVFAGNTEAAVMAAKVTTVNRVVGVYEKELAVRLVLIANNNLLNFLSGTGPQPPTPYTNNNPNGELLSENQSNLDALIGDASYDIGHVFSTAGGGLAQLGVVCETGYKAQGETGTNNPVGDAFDIDYVAHEMGHQFGGNHPFNGNGGSCGGGNRNPNTAWEPGSGSTIMGYAGICGPANDLQLNSDPTFHTGNYEEIQAYISSTSCAVITATGNTAPVVTAPASGKTLPSGTPFKLTASATDAENDALTYSWEELDLGPAGSPTDPQVAGQNVPLFRSFNPTASPTRYFPRLSDLLANTTVIGERLPTVTRTLKFRCTARDEHSGPAGVIGGVDYSALVNLSVSAAAGPFVVTAPNTALTWTGGAAQVVTWNLAGTTAAPISCAQVNIRLSLDGGLTYPTVLASNVPNNGRTVVIAPSLAAATSAARLMVEAANNYFFDISDTNFTITAPSPNPTITAFTPTGGLAGTVVTVLGANFTGATQLTFNGTAAAAFTVNSATQITATAPAGVSTGPIGVEAPAGTATSTTSFTVGPPPVITSVSPTSGYVSSSVVLTGTGFTGATQVTFNGAATTVVTVNSDTQLTVTVPAGASTGPVGVTTPISTGFSATSFTVIPPPSITSFTPTRGGVGTTVVITGFFFTGATAVTFNNLAAPGFVVNSDNQLTVMVPTGVATGPIRIATPAGVGISASNFEVIPDNDLCINAILLICGQSVTGSTIYSTNTDDPTATCTETIDGPGVFYSIVGTGRSITVSTCNSSTNFDTKLFVFTGSCGSSYNCVRGNDDVTCSAHAGSSAVTFASALGVKYLIFVSGFASSQGRFVLSATCVPAAAPTITALSPASGSAGTAVTLNGTNLGNATTITINGLAITGFSQVSSTIITFAVPVGATTGPVVVTSAAGASAGFPFTVTTLTATTQAQQSAFSVYPNPIAGHGTLNLKLATAATTAQATLRTVLGQIVATRTFSGSATELPLSGLAAGTYLLTVQAAGRAPSVQRVVVE
jgi:hypothetical protein